MKRQDERERREGPGYTDEEAHVPSVTWPYWTPVTGS
jgi:hypothetical protein